MYWRENEISHVALEEMKALLIISLSIWQVHFVLKKRLNRINRIIMFFLTKLSLTSEIGFPAKI